MRAQFQLELFRLPEIVPTYAWLCLEQQERPNEKTARDREAIFLVRKERETKDVDIAGKYG